MASPWTVPLATETASGGERRRAALAKLLATDADLLLLDEPTNHLDIQMIGWLEEHLAQSRKSFILISHDRAFLRRLTRGMLWLDRGVLRRLDRGFEAFEDWRDKIHAEEDLERHKLDRLIKAEARWAVEGISARRKRNMGRVRRLQDLRAERASQIRRQGTADLALEASGTAGKLVAEAKEISFAFPDRTIVKEFSFPHPARRPGRTGRPERRWQDHAPEPADRCARPANRLRAPRHQA